MQNARISLIGLSTRKLITKITVEIFFFLMYTFENFWISTYLLWFSTRVQMKKNCGDTCISVRLNNLSLFCRFWRVMVTMDTVYPSLTFTSSTLTFTPSCWGNWSSTWPLCLLVPGLSKPPRWPSTQLVSYVVSNSLMAAQATKRSPHKRKVGCLNPSYNRPKSWKQVVTAPLLNAQQ